MMRFLVFYGDSYYPKGGWKDACRSFATMQEAVAFAEGVTVPTLTWAHVVDLGTGTLVAETGAVVWERENR